MNMEVSMLRDKVLEPLQLALESGNNKLATVAVSGIQVSIVQPPTSK